MRHGDDVLLAPRTEGKTSGVASEKPVTGDSPSEPDTPTKGRSVWAEIPLAIYRFLHSKNTGVVVILVMAFLALLGTLIAQMPAAVREDPFQRAEWLESVRPRYGGWTDILESLGIFNVYSSVLFVTVAALLTLSIIACTVHRLPQLWKRTQHPHVRVSEGFFRHAKVLGASHVPGGTETAYESVTAVLRKQRFRIIDDAGGPATSLYADKNRWGPFGTAAAHLAFVIIILGMLVSSTLGYERYIQATVGTTHPILPESNLTIEATSFSDTYNPDGSPADYVSRLVLRDGDTVLKDEEVRVNSPLTWDGTRIHQTSYGPALALTVTGPGGETVFDRGVPLDWTSADGLYSVGSFQLPDQGFDVVASVPASGSTGGHMAPGEMTLVVYPSGTDQAVGGETLSPGETFELDGLIFAFDRETKFTGLTVARDPGSVWVWIGSVLLMVGTVATFGFRHRRLWVRITNGDDGALVRVAGVDNLDPIQERKFGELLDQIGERREFTTKRTEADRA
ncbi:MAG TPA: cytochrome c biogenesis protein ResB [Actinomycetaceae bacterium]|nr:cytochrome c biogenesis protein ResB [Actinomycetaceae bacterium]